jgi:hypothetical protein
MIFRPHMHIFIRDGKIILDIRQSCKRARKFTRKIGKKSSKNLKRGRNFAFAAYHTGNLGVPNMNK